MKLTDEQLAALKYALVKTMEDVPQEVIDKIILNLDPPAKIDTSLRGWVLVMDGSGNESVWWAFTEGVVEAENKNGAVAYTWDEIREMGWTVHALTPEDIGYRVRKWDEWSEEEQATIISRRGGDWTTGLFVDFAINIATRGEA